MYKFPRDYIITIIPVKLALPQTRKNNQPVKAEVKTRRVGWTVVSLSFGFNHGLFSSRVPIGGMTAYKTRPVKPWFHPPKEQVLHLIVSGNLCSFRILRPPKLAANLDESQNKFAMINYNELNHRSALALKCCAVKTN